ncbi:hypothetical protein OIU77_029735 [Salix suchowensis]|uniref:Uncharacterized protein n=1 Tax=Salix suchowensis TaxID=1278906 RepID=A0ABQ9BB92_9ROSI|nr:hypothetical protein OIU78_003599 [Salix suchowensis]KAJ6380897.1 hypothetical protein OIU77_029735 [Salix suchowensis]
MEISQLNNVVNRKHQRGSTYCSLAYALRSTKKYNNRDPQAWLLVEDWAQRDEIATSKIVESAVNRLMASAEGDEINKRAAELGDVV